MPVQSPAGRNAWRLLAGRGDRRADEPARPRSGAGAGPRRSSKGGSPHASISARPSNQCITGAGKSKRRTEVPVAIKTRAVLYSKVEAAIRRIHPYELPEDRRCPDHRWIRPPISTGSPPKRASALARLRRLACWHRDAALLAADSRLMPGRAEAAAAGAGVPVSARALDATDARGALRRRRRLLPLPRQDAFRRRAGGRRCGAAELPPGKHKHDEFFGDVETYRGALVVKLPVEQRRAGAGDRAGGRLAGLRRRRRLLSAQRRSRSGWRFRRPARVRDRSSRRRRDAKACSIERSRSERSLSALTMATRLPRWLLVFGLRPGRARRRRLFRAGRVDAEHLRATALRRCWASRFPTPRDASSALDQWRGKVLVVNFWATWCAPCREEMPRVRARAEGATARKGLQFVGIAVDQADKVQQFAKEIDLNYPALIGGFGAMELSKTWATT